jgi:pre-mRNA-splicing factor SPF27
LDDILRRIEKELVETREETERVEAERRTIQEGVRGEIEALEESWRKGVGRLVEVQVATEEVKREILERRREGAR